MTRSFVKALLDTDAPEPVRLLYGVATADNTVLVSGSTIAVELPALVAVVSGDYCAVLAAGADRIIIGPVGQVKRGIEMVRYTANGSFVKANYPGMIGVKVRVVGAGGGGGGAATTSTGQSATGGAGGAGAYAEHYLTEADLSASETITIGTGGTGGTGSSNGTDGGNTVAFGITCPGGSLGRGSSATTSLYAAALGGGVSGNPTGTYTHRARGEPGGWGMGTQERNVGGIGGSSHLGTGGTPGNAITAVGGNGGTGYFGGGGGGGANRPSQTTARSGGDGGDGLVIVEVIY